MPVFASEPATTVRQRSPWLFPKVAYGAVFVTIALATYGWKSFNSRPLKLDTPLRVTAKVCIHHPNFAFQNVWQETVAQSKTEVRENLRVEAQQSGQETVVAISLSNQPAETIVPLVNVVASAFSQACRAERKLHLEQAYSAAEEKVRLTERQVFEAQTKFELLRDRRRQVLASVRPVPPPTTIENPRWTETCRRLADLEERRKSLSLERTPLHPSVQEIEVRISDVRREMASIPPKITPELPADRCAVPAPPSALPADVPTANEVQSAQQAAEQLKQVLQQAQALARAANAARGEELRLDLLAAEPLPLPPAPATKVVVGKALVTGATSIVGMGLISVGAALEPAIASIAELQDLLPVPIVGVIPATHPGRRSALSPLRRRLIRWGCMAAGLAVLLAVAWLFFRG